MRYEYHTPYFRGIEIHINYKMKINNCIETRERCPKVNNIISRWMNMIYMYIWLTEWEHFQIWIFFLKLLSKLINCVEKS